MQASCGLAGAGIGCQTAAVGYIVGVVLQTVVLPIVAGTMELVLIGGNPIEIYGRWWVFWGVGTRLVVAGAVQFFRPATTAGILGTAEVSPGEQQVTRELAMANMGMGFAGLLAIVPVWAAPAGAAGGVFLLAAGLMHVMKKGKNAQETVATWTDLLVGAVAIVLVAWSLMGRLLGSS